MIGTTDPSVDEIRNSWFKNHVAVLTKHAEHLHELVWKQPGTGIFGMTYILCGGTLMVHGDLGEAIYRWGGREDHLTFPWLADCSLDYFHSKCCASEYGREYIRFDAEIFRMSLGAELKGLDINLDEEDLRSGLGDIGTEFEAREFLYRTIPSADSEKIAVLLCPGRIIDRRCVSHLIGIQMAVAQLAEKTKSNA